MRTKALLLALFLLVSAPLMGEEPGRARRAAVALGGEARQYARDLGAFASAPLHWRSREWAAATATITAFGVVLAADEEISAAFERNRSDASEKVAGFVTPLGGSIGEDLSIVMLVGGWATKNERIRVIGRDALEAQLLTTRIVVPLLKSATGRSRPNRDEGSAEFDPFGDEESFPSSHSASAFALAAAVAEHTRGTRIPAIAYGLASLVAVARVHDRAHFASDVLAGAAIGATMGRVVVRRRDPGRITVLPRPLVSEDGVGVLVSLRFANR
jgi:membrane-associated phospholipid phosphatase